MIRSRSWSMQIMQHTDHVSNKSWSMQIMKHILDHEACRTRSTQIMQHADREAYRSWSIQIAKHADQEACRSWSIQIMKHAEHEALRSCNEQIVKHTDHEAYRSRRIQIMKPADHEALLRSLFLLYQTYVQMFSLAPCFQTPSRIHVLPLLEATNKFLTKGCPVWYKNYALQKADLTGPIQQQTRDKLRYKKGQMCSFIA